MVWCVFGAVDSSTTGLCYYWIYSHNIKMGYHTNEFFMIELRHKLFWNVITIGFDRASLFFKFDVTIDCRLWPYIQEWSNVRSHKPAIWNTCYFLTKAHSKSCILSMAMTSKPICPIWPLSYNDVQSIISKVNFVSDKINDNAVLFIIN